MNEDLGEGPAPPDGAIDRGLDRADELARDALTAMLFGEAEPERIGRYRILRVLGEGGMGVVFHAHDDELARPVALKILREHRGQGREARARLLREAQAMAQLSHPNVVQIYDVGEHDGQVFLAMELIRGETLREWVLELGEPPARARRWREIVATFVQAGRGLAAAHDAGLVHRDFKPANALVGEDGRVRVLDFGLARAPGTSEAPDAGDVGDAGDAGGASDVRDAAAATTIGALLRLDGPTGASGGPRPLFAETMTVAGTIMGTLAYISPEQLKGVRAEAPSDQFSFCASLLEALCGVRPFVGASPNELMESMRAGRRAAIPPGQAPPAWLAQVIDRGLALDPAARWPSMHALIDALLDDPAIRRRNRLLGAGAFTLAGLIGLGAWAHETRERAACEASGDAVFESWDEPAKARVRAAFTATGLDYADDSASRAIAGLDGWTRTWRDARAKACHDARAGMESGPLRARCLDRQRWQLASTAGVLGDASEGIVARAVPMIAGLPRPGACERPGALALASATNEDTSAQAGQVREQIALATVDTRAGLYARALERAQAAREEAEALADDALRAEALVALGEVQTQQGDYAAAEASLHAGFFLASGVGHDPAVADAGTSLMGVVGYYEARTKEGFAWAEHVRAAARRMGDEEPGARFFQLLGYVQTTAGEYPEAAASIERALELQERELGPEHPALAELLSDLGTMMQILGDFDREIALMERALEISTRALGPSHPQVAQAIRSLGLAEHGHKRYEAAVDHYRRALALQEASLGPEHPEVATTLAMLGISLRELGALDEALDLHRRALALAEARLGEHAELASFRTYLGSTLTRLGRFDEAIVHYHAALEERARHLGEEHPDLAESLNNLGYLLEGRGRYEEALTHYRRALALQERALGPEHVLVASTLDNLGVASRELGMLDEALAAHQRALAIRERGLSPEHPEFAASYDNLGVVRLRMGAPAEALALHERALAVRLRTRGARHVLTAKTHRRLADAALASGDRVVALEHYREALGILDEVDAPPADERGRVLAGIGRALLASGDDVEGVRSLEGARAAVREQGLDPRLEAAITFDLARALARTRARRGEARALALAASDALAPLGASGEASRAAITAWLDGRE